MIPLPDLSVAVSQRLESFTAERRAEALRESPQTAPLLDAAAVATTGGKRLRARFCHTGWRAVSPRIGADAIVSVATALEVFQAAALVHDDLIDNSDTRRGKPAAHRALESVHRTQKWSGDPDGFGRSAAILLGDLLVAWSDDLLEDALVDLPTAAKTRAEYARMRREVTIGQYLDVAQESAWIQQEDADHARHALEIASLKSARYSVMRPLLIGAILGGGSADQLHALEEFGLPIGLAFQLRDDVLGVFGDADLTGKPAGDDLREGKRTLLVAHAREHLHGTSRAFFDEMLGDPALEADQIRMLQATIRETGALERVEASITAYATDADRALRGAPLDHAAVSELRGLARAATHRTA